jgi:hypothetical protein
MASGNASAAAVSSEQMGREPGRRSLVIVVSQEQGQRKLLGAARSYLRVKNVFPRNYLQVARWYIA